MAGLSKDVTRFIIRYVESVEELEVLLLLRERSEKEWAPDEIAKVLRATASSIELRLERLHALRLAEPRGELRFSYPHDHPLDGEIGQVADAYRSKRTKVIELIFSPTRRAQSFSDAFRMRRDD